MREEMREKLIKIIRSKPFLIVISFISAIIAWLFVLNFTNPMTERTLEVPITVTNVSNLSHYELLNTTSEIPGNANVTVTGRKTIIDNLTALDFECSFNLGSVTEPGEKVIKLSTPVCSKMGVSVKKYTPSEVTFTFDKTSISTLQVVLDYSDDLLKSGYEFINVYPDTESIQVSGLESEISQLDYIEIDLNSILEKGSLESNRSASYLGKFIREGGEDVTAKFDPVSIIVKMEVGKRVPLFYSIAGDPDSDYYVNSDSISSSSILIQGPATELHKIESINLGTISVDGATESINKDFDVSDSLPDGVSVYGNSKVTVNIEILQYETREFVFDIDEINLAGVDETEYEYQFYVNTITVKVRGIRETLEQFKKSSLEPTIDLTGKVGDFRMLPLDLTMDVPGLEIVGEYTVRVTITPKQETQSAE